MTDDLDDECKRHGVQYRVKVLVKDPCLHGKFGVGGCIHGIISAFYITDNFRTIAQSQLQPERNKIPFETEIVAYRTPPPTIDKFEDLVICNTIAEAKSKYELICDLIRNPMFVSRHFDVPPFILLEFKYPS